MRRSPRHSPRKRQFIAESNAEAVRRKAREDVHARPAIASAAGIAALAQAAAMVVADDAAAETVAQAVAAPATTHRLDEDGDDANDDDDSNDDESEVGDSDVADEKQDDDDDENDDEDDNDDNYEDDEDDNEDDDNDNDDEPQPNNDGNDIDTESMDSDIVARQPSPPRFWRHLPEGWVLFDEFNPSHRRLVIGTRVRTVLIEYKGHPQRSYLARLARTMEDFNLSVFVYYDDDPITQYQIRRGQLYAWATDAATAEYSF